MTNKLKLLTGLLAITAMSWTVGNAALAHRSDERDADSLEQFHADGTGLISGPDTAEQTATIKGSFIRGSATLNFKLSNDVTFGLFCGFRTGDATITDSHGKTITMSLAGVGCSVPEDKEVCKIKCPPPKGPPPPNKGGKSTDNTEATYVITGGTKGATGGTGRLTRGITNAGTIFVQFDGNIILSDED